MFAGTPEIALPALRALLASTHEVVGVITRPDAPAGRGRRRAPSPVAALARESGIEVLTPDRLAGSDVAERLRAWRVDACPVVAYGGLIPPDLLSVPRHGWINLHFSLLPAWRGAAPVHWAIWSGDHLTGISVFRIDAGLDTGPVYAQRSIEITDRQTTGELLERLAVDGAELLVHTLDAIADGTAHAVEQSTSGVSLAPRLSVDDARVDWRQHAEAVDRHIRSMTPSPGAWTVIAGDGPEAERRVLLGPLAGSDHEVIPVGEVHQRAGAAWVGTGTCAVRLDSVRPSGRRQMPAMDWLRGLRRGAEPVRFLSVTGNR